MIVLVKKFWLAGVCILISISSLAGEGMWLPQLLQSLNEKDMKKQGMKISAADVYSISKSSLKDAIVSLGGFCTAEVISEKGLILTNHHCAFDAIQNHSSLQDNYIRDGFWAKDRKNEKPNHGLTATFIVRIDDVTSKALAGIPSSLTGKERQSAIDKNLEVIKTGAKRESHQDVIIRPFFEANKYFLFVTEVYKDVRLVGAPPSAIGNFGKDTDNWMWPRHTGDFALFRIYAGKDNKPATYSPDNVPYKPRRSLNISLDGVEENDFTMVFGFPGRTYQYLHSAAVSQIMHTLDPARIAIRGKALQVMDKHMRADEQIKIQYATKYAKMENYYKKWKGEVLGLTSKNALAKKLAYEKTFQERVNASTELQSRYGTLLADLERANKALEPFALAREMHNEITAKIDVFTAAQKLIALVNAYEKNGVAGYEVQLNRQRGALDTLYHEYNSRVDQELFEVLMDHYANHMDTAFQPPLVREWLKQYDQMGQLASAIYEKTILDDSVRVQQLLTGDARDVIQKIKDDEAVHLFNGMQRYYMEKVAGNYATLVNQVNELQRQYMKAQMEVMTERAFYPDANSTLRVTYGQAKGMKPRNGMRYEMMTDLDGVMEKYIPGDYEFDVPQKLIDLHARKDYGRYGVNGKMPVCFIATNHTTGGNSGSPALDAYGNLVGLNFDRAWEGTMSDIYYDESICRNIMVDIRYVLFIIDKFAGAGHLVDEMRFVHPKKKAVVPPKKKAA